MSQSPAYNYCALPLAAYACAPEESKGRMFDVPESRFRTCFQRDRDRIIHTAAFRRLKYKTQVFVEHEGDHFRTRLTHSLEVAQIARTLARALLVNEDLAESVALAHDLGHPPFAHAGEDALQDCMKDVGGYDHNDQSLRVVTELEIKYPDYRGLNLSWETLEGIAKHNGPMLTKGKSKDKSEWRARRKKDLPPTVRKVDEAFDLRLDTFAPVEAQIAALADDIAYNTHDVDDGLSAGLFRLEDIADVPLLGRALSDFKTAHGEASRTLQKAAVIRYVIGALVEDVLAESERRLKALDPKSPDDVRLAGQQMVDFSDGMQTQIKELRAFLWSRVYKHYKVNRVRHKVTLMIRALYDCFMDDTKLLPDEWQDDMRRAGGEDDKRTRARIVADYIAGMTDRYAMKEYERICDLSSFRT